MRISSNNEKPYLRPREQIPIEVLEAIQRNLQSIFTRMIQGDCTPGTSSGASQRQLQQEFRENVSTFFDQPLQSSHIAVKPPVFLKSNPHIFFIQIETSFRRANISRDDTKYDHVVGALDAQILELIFFAILPKRTNTSVSKIELSRSSRTPNRKKFGNYLMTLSLVTVNHLSFCATCVTWPEAQFRKQF